MFEEIGKWLLTVIILGAGVIAIEQLFLALGKPNRANWNIFGQHED